MRSDTQTVTIHARPEAVLGFVGDAENLPRWAVGFAKAVARDGDRWIVRTGADDEVGLTVEVHGRTGTVDFVLEPCPGMVATAYGRVVPNGDGAEFVFTQFQQPGTSDEVFAALVAALGHELTALKAVLEVRCPT